VPTAPSGGAPASTAKITASPGSGRVGGRDGRRALAVGAFVAAAALSAQALTVQCNYGGNWTALFHHGALFPLPQELSSEGIYLFPHTFGYDGQIYHVIAHDPLLERGFARQVDDPRLRYRRILLPALAHTLAGGTPAALHAAYTGLVVLAAGLGAAGLAAWAMRHGRGAAWGVLFLFVPATFVSLDRLTSDVALAALTVAFVLWSSPRRTTPLLAVIVLATLVRETGLLLWAAALGAALVQRDWRQGGLLLPALLPALAWYTFVAARTPAASYPNSFVPFQGTVGAFLEPPDRGEPPPDTQGISPLRARWRSVAPIVTATLARAGLLGALCAIAMGLALLRDPGGPTHLVAVAFSLLAVFLQRPDNWLQVYDYGRVYSPLLVVLAMRSVAGSRWGLLPLALMVPSMLMQTSGEASGILKCLP